MERKQEKSIMAYLSIITKEFFVPPEKKTLPKKVSSEIEEKEQR